MAVDKPSFFFNGPLMYYPIVSVNATMLECRGTYIGDGICMVSRNQRLGIDYIPIRDKASEIIPYSLNSQFTIWIEQFVDGIGYELGEMLQSFQAVWTGFGVCRLVPWSMLVLIGTRRLKRQPTQATAPSAHRIFP